MLKHKTWLIDTLSKALESNDLLLLYGDVGAGKTTFTKDLCAAIGVLQVSSPTYTLVNHYCHDNLRIIHSDLYRLNDVDYEIISEIYSQDAISIIEWADRMNETHLMFFKNFLQIYIYKNNDIVNIVPHGRFVQVMNQK